MTFDEIKRNRIVLKCQNRDYARLLNEEFPDVEYITIQAVITSRTGCNGKIKKEKFERRILPNEKLFVYYDCLNEGCTGNGIDFTSEICFLLQNKQKEKLLKRSCDGKEDFKYLHSNGNTCCTDIECKLSICYKG